MVSTCKRDCEKYNHISDYVSKLDKFLNSAKAIELVAMMTLRGLASNEIASILAAIYDTGFSEYLEKETEPKKFAMLSQPLGRKTDEEIAATRERAIKVLTRKGYDVVNTLFTDDWYKTENMKARGVVQIPLCFLAKSLENMSKCHTAYFCKGWENARGCRIEHEAAKAYGLEILYEE